MVTAYRDDIDGLRAVAVLAVVFFHAGIGTPGGFVGVDVFFVISGYLITSLLIADFERGTFSLRRFWERRIRRIWPASSLVILVTLAAGWFALFPVDYRAQANNAISQLAMLANVRYWLKTDYFADYADLDPLLHLWSLAVEEQFYVFLPFVLQSTWRLGRARCATVLGTLAAVSLVSSAIVLPTHPMAVFYLLPFRAWELLLGSLLSFAPPCPGNRLRELLGLAGLALILGACFAYDRATPFPGLAALVPCVGAALVIVAGTGAGTAAERPVVNRFLGGAAFTWVGKVSYSMYLWHWPILAFYRYSNVATPSPLVKAEFLAIVVVVAYCSWRWIETPFRAAAKPPASTRALALVGLLSLLVVALAVPISLARGFPSRFSQATLRLLEHDACCLTWETPEGSAADPLPIGARAADRSDCFLIWGDSHGMAVSPVFDAVAREFGLGGHAALKRGHCPVLFQAADNAWLAGDVQRWNESLLKWLRENRPRHVVLVARWSNYFKPRPDGDPAALTDPYSESSRAAWPRRQQTLRDGLLRLAHECEKTDSTIWCLLEVPYQNIGVRERVLAASWSGCAVATGGTSRLAHMLRMEPVRDVFDAVRSPRLRVVDLAEPLFDGGDISTVRSGETWLYADDDHLGTSGAMLALGPVVREILAEVAVDCDGPTTARAAHGAPFFSAAGVGCSTWGQ